MKFHCDRCKTQYSISDDRVRGKILKIRCKKCSEIITVRESSQAKKGNGSGGLAGSGTSAKVKVSSSAQEKVKTTSSPASAKGKEPVAREGLAEAKNRVIGAASEVKETASKQTLGPNLWHLSVDGQQEGPFSLAKAKAWIVEKPSLADVHCWKEGYDDWLSVEEVACFGGLRKSASGLQDCDEPTLQEDLGSLAAAQAKPMFEPTGGHLAASPENAPPNDDEVGPTVADAGPFSNMLGGSSLGGPKSGPAVASGGVASSVTSSVSFPESAGGGASPNLDFEIGEASRVVDLPALMAARGHAPAFGAASPVIGLPGTATSTKVGRGSGKQEVLAGAGAATPGDILASDASTTGDSPRSKKSKSLLVPLIAVGVVVLGITGVMLFMLGNLEDEGKIISRGRVGGNTNLGYSFQGKRLVAKGALPAVVVPPPSTNKRNGRTGSRIRRNNGSNSSANKLGELTQGVLSPLPLRDPGEVDLGTSGVEAGPTGPLDGDDLMRVYRKNQIAIKMCYERSLKKNPLLKVPKTWVDIEVGLNGRVTGVSIPSLAGTPLSGCMRSRIARWKFRKTTELFSSRFSVVFDR